MTLLTETLSDSPSGRSCYVVGGEFDSMELEEAPLQHLEFLIVRGNIMEKWKTKRTENLIDTRWVKVRKDEVELPNRQTIEDFYAITISDAAAIVALDTVGNVIFKKEYRYCYDRDLIEVPAGIFEEGETDGLAVARRELLEETGYVSDDWKYIGATVESSAKLTNYMHIYFANHCRKVSGQHLGGTETRCIMGENYGLSKRI